MFIGLPTLEPHKVQCAWIEHSELKDCGSKKTESLYHSNLASSCPLPRHDITRPSLLLVGGSLGRLDWSPKVGHVCSI